MGASDTQTLRAIEEAESYHGPSLVIAYAHCIAHGINMAKGMDQQKLAAQSGHWPLYRYDPRRAVSGQNPLQLDSRAPSISIRDYIYNENRYRVLTQTNAEAAKTLLDDAQKSVEKRWQRLEAMAKE